jgi:hypothetical protein
MAAIIFFDCSVGRSILSSKAQARNSFISSSVRLWISVSSSIFRSAKSHISSGTTLYIVVSPFFSFWITLVLYDPLILSMPLRCSLAASSKGFAAKNRLPAIYPGSSYVDTGGLMSYAANNLDMYRRAATYVDKILKGAKPADLPVEQPMKFEFVVNLKTAKQLGLIIPPNVLVRADRVIR